MSKEYQCIVDAAAIVGFNMPAMNAGTQADIQSFSHAGETVAKGTYLGTDGLQHELVARAVPPSNLDDPTHYFAGINARDRNGASVQSSESISNNQGAFQKLVSCIPSG